MLKQLRGVAVVGISGLAFATSAFAGAPGVYVGGQIGAGITQSYSYSKSSLENALQSANYTLNTYKAKNADKTGLAGRVFIGYQVDSNFALEAGYTQFSNQKLSLNATATEDNGLHDINLSSKGTIKTHAFDLVGKAIYPIQNGFSIYGKAGVAYLAQSAKASADVSGVHVVGNAVQQKFKGNENAILPTFGLGVSYDITPNVVADVSWNRIQKVGNKTSLSSTDFVGVGLAYNFG